MKSVLAVCSLFVFLSLAGVARADSTDLWQDFPDTQGVNHFYALALPWNNTGDGSYIWMDDLGDYKFGTSNATPSFVPYIYRNTDQWIEMYPSTNGGVNGTGLAYENPIYTYKVPTTMVANITGTFKKGDTGDTYVFVKHNRDFIWNHTFLSTDDTGTEASFYLSGQLLNATDEVYFGVGCGGSKKNIGDTTFLKGQINAVPEPISCVLFLVGAGVFGAAARRRRRFK